jgi:RNA polymerase sigma-70 factor (ECF subfamily)
VPAHPADVYLCAACADGQTAAYRALEAAYFPAAYASIRRLLGDASAQEVLQEVRTRLFVGPARKIASYRGHGRLLGWLRTVAIHAAQDHLRAASAQRGWLVRLAGAQHPNATLAAAEGTDEQLFQMQRARPCAQAWSSAIGALGSAERQLLHHHFVAGLSIDVLGTLYSVHRATVARRIRRATDRVRSHVRKALAQHDWDLSAGDLDALALRACGNLDVVSALEPPYAA